MRPADLAIIILTFNERDNIGLLAPLIDRALAGVGDGVGWKSSRGR